MPQYVAKRDRIFKGGRLYRLNEVATFKEDELTQDELEYNWVSKDALDAEQAELAEAKRKIVQSGVTVEELSGEIEHLKKSVTEKSETITALEKEIKALKASAKKAANKPAVAKAAAPKKDEKSDDLDLTDLD